MWEVGSVAATAAQRVCERAGRRVTQPAAQWVSKKGTKQAADLAVRKDGGWASGQVALRGYPRELAAVAA